MRDLHCDRHRLLDDVLIEPSVPRAERSTFMRAPRFSVPALLVALSLGAAACAAHRRCEVRELAMMWTDGTRTTWVLTTCADGRVTVRPR